MMDETDQSPDQGIINDLINGGDQISPVGAVIPAIPTQPMAGDPRVQARRAALQQAQQLTAQERESVLQPMERGLSDTMSQPSPTRPESPGIPEYKPYQMEPQQYEKLSYQLLAMALIGGVTSHGNWMGVSSALNGAMKGIIESDQLVATKHLEDYKTQFAAAKAQEEKVNREFEQILNDRKTTINEKIALYKVVSAKYDRQDQRYAAETKSIDQMEKQTEDRKFAMERLQQSHQDSMARLAETQVYHHEMMSMRRDIAEKKEAASHYFPGGVPQVSDSRITVVPDAVKEPGTETSTATASGVEKSQIMPLEDTGWTNQESVNKYGAMKSVQEAAVDPMRPVQDAAWSWILSGKPPTTRTARDADFKDLVAKEKARIGVQMGLSSIEMQNISAFREADKKSLDKAVPWMDAIERSSNVVEQNVKLMEKYAKDLDLGRSQSWNQLKINAYKSMGNKDAQAYLAACNTVMNEYARLMAGPLSSAMTPEGARHKAEEALSPYMSKGQLKEVVHEVLEVEARNQLNQSKATVNGIKSRMNAPGEKKTVADAPVSLPQSGTTVTGPGGIKLILDE